MKLRESISKSAPIALASLFAACSPEYFEGQKTKDISADVSADVKDITESDVSADVEDAAEGDGADAGDGFEADGADTAGDITEGDGKDGVTPDAFADAGDVTEGDALDGADGTPVDVQDGGVDAGDITEGDISDDADGFTPDVKDGANDAGADTTDGGDDVATDAGADVVTDAGADVVSDTGADTEDVTPDGGNGGLVCVPPAVKVSFQVNNGLYPGADAQKPMDEISVEEIRVLSNGQKESNGTPNGYVEGERIDTCLTNNQFVVEITTFCANTNAKCAATISIFDGTTLNGYHPLTSTLNSIPDIQMFAPANGEKKAELVELPGKTSLFHISE